MNERLLKKRELKWLLTGYSIFIIAFGILLFCIKFFFLEENVTIKDALLETISQIGFVIFSTALFSYIFKWIEQKERIFSIQEHIGFELDKLSLQIRKMAIDSNTYHNQEWSCWLSPLTDSQKELNNNNEYWNQTIYTSKYQKLEHSNYKLIFAVGGQEDGLLKAYFHNPRYLVNYKIEAKDLLPVDSSLVHSLNFIEVNGKPVKFKQKVFT
jgi:hypothetical protein